MSKKAVEAFLSAKDAGKKVSTPRIPLTMSLCEWLPTKPYDYEVLDDGFRPLRIRVRKSGSKTLEVAKKVGGRNCRSKVSDFTVQGGLPFKRKRGDDGETVHSRAGDLVRDMEQGRNASVKRSERALRAIEEARVSVTVGDTLKDYINSRERAENTTKGYKTMRKSHLSPWEKKRLIDITPAMVVDLHKANSEKIGPVAANNAMRLFRATWMANRRKLGLGECPTYILSPKENEDAHQWTRETRKTRRVHPEEIRDWWLATDELAEVTIIDGKEHKAYKGDGELGRDYLRFVLFTGLRRREASNLKWEEIDFRRKTLTLTENKADRELIIPLTDSMLEILARREGEVRPFALEEPKKFVAWVRDRSGVPFSVHDLRRTFAGIADELDISLTVIKSLLNHSDKHMKNSGDVTEGYIGPIPEHRKRRALERIEAFILSRVGVVDNVVEGEFGHG
jgi:integrase